MTTAKRGDLAVIEKETSYVTTDQGYHKTTEYEVGIVTNITREGQVKACRFRLSDTTTQLKDIIRVKRTLIVPQSEINVESAARAAWSNPWPSGHEGMPFDSLDAVKDVLRPFAASAA